MGLLRPVVLDRRALLQEIEDLRAFLAGRPRAERAEFLPFFGAREQLCAFLGMLNSVVRQADHVAHEFPLWGDFVCDVVAGSKADGAFVFVEFEDAGATSMFRAVRSRKVSRWGARVEAGISQVTDWLFRLDGARNTSEMEREFGHRRIRPFGLVVVGRRSELTAYDTERMNWRSENSVVGGAKIVLMTYDDLLDWLDGRVDLLRRLE